MAYCGKCGTKVDEGVKFCPSCGNSMEAPAPGQHTFFGYNDMADAKSLLESIARSFGYIYGREKHVRINTISQSPTITTAGSGVKGMEHLMDFASKMSPLGNASAEECADYCVMMFSDFTRKVTMQNLYHDGECLHLVLHGHIVLDGGFR